MIEMQQKSGFLKLAIEVAQEAGKLLCQHLKQGISYELKSSHHDLVTEVDRLAEQAILSKIRQAHPEHGILSEESPPLGADSPYRWVIDPLDGTTNYAHGIPFFGVSIALEGNDQPLVGVIYDPWHEELFTAAVGEGAHLNGRSIRVSSARTLRESLLATGAAYRSPLRERNLDYYRRFFPKAQGLRRLGSAALCLAYVAAGRLDGYWDLYLHRWDMAAGYLLVKEAGGRVSDPFGQEIRPEGRALVASNGLIHEEMLEVFLDGADAH